VRIPFFVFDSAGKGDVVVGNIFAALRYTVDMDFPVFGRTSMDALTQLVYSSAFRLGFDLCGVVPIGKPPHGGFFERWLALGRAAEMRYLERFVEKRLDPALLADGKSVFRSMIVVGVDYGRVRVDPAVLADAGRGVIARYAWRSDYHDTMRPALYELDAEIRRFSGRAQRGKALVDTGPVLERDWAQMAGLGFTGKNCCTIHPHLGSWLLLGTLMVPEVFDVMPVVADRASVGAEDVAEGLAWNVRLGRWEVPVAGSHVTGTCGSCTRCLSECPTDAFVGPLHLDPAACISYWTIESRQAIPRGLRSSFGNRIFGCDVCQEVCPWNRKRSIDGNEAGLASAMVDRVAPRLLEGFQVEFPYWLQDDAFARRFAESPVLRPGRAGMLRNVCVALGNWGDSDAIHALETALRDVDPLPRGHAAWALGRLHSEVRPRAHGILRSALDVESVDWVREEIQAALCAP
jgi:epoxyqueuosine reductase